MRRPAPSGLRRGERLAWGGTDPPQKRKRDDRPTRAADLDNGNQGSPLSSVSPNPVQPRSLRLLGFRRFRRNSLFGFLDIEVSSGLRIFDITLMKSGAAAWVGLPAKARIDENGHQAIDPETGKKAWLPVIQWRDRRTADAFSKAVIAALLRAHPDALGDDGAPP
jgi:hypothetical protein